MHETTMAPMKRWYSERAKKIREDEEDEAQDELAQREGALLGHVAHRAVDRALGPAQREANAEDVGDDRRVHGPKVEQDAHRREAQVEELEDLLEPDVPRPDPHAALDILQVRFDVCVVRPHGEAAFRFIREEALLGYLELVLREDGEREAREQRRVRAEHAQVACVELHFFLTHEQDLLRDVRLEILLVGVDHEPQRER